jgi:hypothetical protein
MVEDIHDLCNLENIDKQVSYGLLHIDRNYNWFWHKDLDKIDILNQI